MIIQSKYNNNYPTNQFLKQLIEKNEIKFEAGKRIFLTPHALVPESQKCSLLTLSSLPESPNKIVIIATNHGSVPNETIKITNENEFLEKEHSARINKKIILELRKKFNPNNFIYYVISKKNGINEMNIILNKLENFLNENPNNVIIMTTDLSHEYNITTSKVLEQEKYLLSYIFMNKIYDQNQQIFPKEIENISACGGYNLYLFLRLCKKLNQYIEIIDYNNSNDMKNYWTSEPHKKIVFYLGLSNNNNMENTFWKNIKFYLKFLCSYSKSLLLEKIEGPEDKITFPDYNLNLKNPIFLTILINGKEYKVLGCIGDLSDKNLEEKVKDLSVNKIIDDNKKRWNIPLTPGIVKSKNFKLELSILEKPNRWKKVDKPIKDDNLGYVIVDGEISEKEFQMKPHWSGLFLPSVWKENPKWDANKYISELKGKGTLNEQYSFSIFSFKSIKIEQGKNFTKEEDIILEEILYSNPFNDIINHIKNNREKLREINNSKKYYNS